MEKLEAGDLRDTLAITSQDEFGTLGNSTNRLTDSLRETVRSLTNGSQELAACAEETEAVSRHSQKSISEQKLQTLSIATAINEMSQAVSNIAKNAAEASVQVQNATEEANNGKKIVEHNAEKIQQLSSRIQESSAVIHRLNEYSDNIGSVLEVIRNIANQTNLLALNAAIEAARAGEQGRGFAVVADEVRSLAVKTQDSTSEIQSMIERLQQGTREAVSAMNISSQEASNSVEYALSAGVALNRITEMVQAINAMSLEIASAAEEGSTVTDTIKHSAQAIVNGSEITIQCANDNLQASSELARLATHLRALVGKFQTQ